MNSVAHIDVKEIPMFFVLGRPRSGTTLLASLLDAHPNVVLPFECPLIINIYSKYASIKRWDEELIREFTRDIVTQRKFESWRLSEQDVFDHLIKYKGENSFETIIKALYIRFKSFFDKAEILIIGDKNPVYSIYPDQLLELFPEAKFIHLTRDYRDNILSIKKVDFEAPITALLAYRWRFAEKRIFNAKKKHPDSFYSLRYEDLVHEPKVQLKILSDFLGIDYDESVLDFHKKKDDLFKDFDRNHIEKYHSSLLKPISSDKIFGWKKKMSDKDIKIADSIVGGLAEINGYERKSIKNNSLSLVSLIWMVYGYFSYLQRFIVDILPFRLKMRIRNKGPLLAVIFNKYFSKK